MGEARDQGEPPRAESHGEGRIDGKRVALRREPQRGGRRRQIADQGGEGQRRAKRAGRARPIGAAHEQQPQHRRDGHRHIGGLEPDAEQHATGDTRRRGEKAAIAPSRACERHQGEHELGVVVVDLARTKRRQQRDGRQRGEPHRNGDHREHRGPGQQQRPDAAGEPLGEIRRGKLPEQKDQSGNAGIHQA